MTPEDFLKLLQKLTDQNMDFHESYVILRYWDINGQLILKHYQGKKDVFIIYMN